MSSSQYYYDDQQHLEDVARVAAMVEDENMEDPPQDEQDALAFISATFSSQIDELNGDGRPKTKAEFRNDLLHIVNSPFPDILGGHSILSWCGLNPLVPFGS